MSKIGKIFFTIIIIILVVLAALFIFPKIVTNGNNEVVKSETPLVATTSIEVKKPVGPKETTDKGLITLKLGETKEVRNISISPIKIVEESRCPIGANCIQAGKISINVAIKDGPALNENVFLVGKPFIIGFESVTLVEVTPTPKVGETILETDYNFVFRIVPSVLPYKNASINVIKVVTPEPLQTVGKEFEITGSAKGQWFFESTSRVKVLNKENEIIFEGVARALKSALTTNLVPFSASIKITDPYVGPVKVVLMNDNPSGLPENESYMSFPLNIE